MQFDHWQRWGVALDDVSFANAWLALGLVHAVPPDALREVRSLPHGLWWYFPATWPPAAGTPQQWAQAGREFAQAANKPLRLRVYADALNEPILPWYRLLGEARPAPDSVSLRIEPPRSHLDVQWPLRCGALTEPAWRVLESVSPLWPSSKIARMRRLGREQTNCDLLVHRAPLKSLLQTLLDLPYGIRANVIVAHAGQADWGEERTLLDAVLDMTRASGFILVPPTPEGNALVQLLNGFAAELSHAQTVDVALALAAKHHKQHELVAGFTEQLAAFTLKDLGPRYNSRLEALPRGTELDLSKVGQSSDWLARGVAGGGRSGGGPRRSMLTTDDRYVAVETVTVIPEEMVFDSEHQGGATMAEIGDALARATPPPAAQEKRMARFLQQKSFVRRDNELQEASEGFYAGLPAIVRVRIGAPEQGWDASPSEFPIDRLPPDLERWNLTVWLTEPDHLPQPLKRQISLPRDGNSTEAEFQFKPWGLPRFEGRLTVLHRGRVIQTAVLRAGVVLPEHPRAKNDAPTLGSEIVVRYRIGELDARREFDVALVANHDSQERPLLAAVSAKAAWVKDLKQIADIAKDINKLFDPVAQVVDDYADGLDGKNGVAFLIQLAGTGSWLYEYLNTSLGDPANNPLTAQAEYIQIVSTRPDAVVPLELVYDYAVPDDDAVVCKHWRRAVRAGRCPASCSHSSGKTVCPLGFWGLRKVIERHAGTPDLEKNSNVLLYLQSEPGRTNDTLHLDGACVLGSSDRVQTADVTDLKKTLKQHCGKPPRYAKDWDEWETLVTKHHPTLLVALAHTDGKTSNVTLEIGGKRKRTITLRDTHVFPPPTKDRQPPLVALIGCDVAGTADDYGNHVLVFRARGAAVVIGTIATVFGQHAARVAQQLVAGMLPIGPPGPVRLGELIRDVRRQALLDNLLMPLCLVAYGDADWFLARESE